MGRRWACVPSCGTLSRRVPGGLPLLSQLCEVLQRKQVLFQGPGGVNLMPEVHKEEMRGGPGAPSCQPHFRLTAVFPERAQCWTHSRSSRNIY